MMSHGAMIRKHGRRAAFIVVVSMMLSGALLLALASLPRPEGPQDTQRTLVKKFANEGYPLWVAHHPGQRCPSSLREVADELGRIDAKDAWGQELIWTCGDGFTVASVGRDGIAGTADDIRSWD
jgi:hypothetical protein